MTATLNLPTKVGGWLDDPTLGIHARALDDIENMRKSLANRLRILTTPIDVEDEDGIARGHGIPADHPEAVKLAMLLDTTKAIEDQAVKNLEKAMKAHPLGPWVKSQGGVGDKQAARLLAAVGDPYWNDLHERPRTVSELWAYAGMHVNDGEAARRKKGVKSNWSTDAKTRAWLIIQSCQKQLKNTCESIDGIATHADDCKCSPYRIAIDARRQHTAVTRPDWTKGHSLADGQRVAAKLLLKNLWIEAKRLYDEG